MMSLSLLAGRTVEGKIRDLLDNLILYIIGLIPHGHIKFPHLSIICVKVGTLEGFLHGNIISRIQRDNLLDNLILYIIGLIPHGHIKLPHLSIIRVKVGTLEGFLHCINVN